MPDPPFALPPCSARWGHHLADPVHQVSRGVHRPPPLRLALSPDATRGGPRRPVGAHGGLSLELCAIIWHISPMASLAWSAPLVSTVS